VGWLLCALIALGCQGQVTSLAEHISSAKQNLVTDNGLLLVNGINLYNGAGSDVGNGIVMRNGADVGNGISPQNGIDVGNGIISPPAGSDLDLWLSVDPVMRAKLIKYTIQCALDPSQTITFTHGGITEFVPGIANLGAGWAWGHMSVAEQQAVTACLLARVNAAGQTVQIDMFGDYPGLDYQTDSEAATWGVNEAIFFGNLFKSPPSTYVVVEPVGGTPGYPVHVCDMRSCRDASDNCLSPFDGDLYTIESNPSQHASCGALKVPSSGAGYYRNLSYTGVYYWMYWDNTLPGEDGTTYWKPISVFIHAKPAGARCYSQQICASGSCVNGYCL
jgi:hypothetical protein